MAAGNTLFQNLSIYNDNLSTFYVGSFIISLLSFIIACWYSKYEKKESPEPVTVEMDPNERNSSEDTDVSSDGNIMTQIKVARQSAITKQLSEGLTEDQLKEEREAEAEQLEAIYNLLRVQEDKFQVGSIEELKDQMRLYKQ